MSGEFTVDDMKVLVFDHDLPIDLVLQTKRAGTVAWDTETSGLNWKSDTLATCQLCVPLKFVAIVKLDGSVPRCLSELLSDATVQKIYHHAMFDLRFMSYWWGVRSRNVVCTRISAKLLDPGNLHSHSLKSLLKRCLGKEITKEERLSNWMTKKLTEEQVAYAARDVIYLHRLHQYLWGQLSSQGLGELATRCFDHIPARVALDIQGYNDIFNYD